MDSIIDIKIGEVKVVKPPIRLRASALGSCVAVVLYDNVERIGGMAHVMLPTTPRYPQASGQPICLARLL